MLNQVFSTTSEPSSRSEQDLDETLRQQAAPSGKPYHWQLPQPENPELVALSPEALAERAFHRTAAFQRSLQRAAAYFIVVSRVNEMEGRDPLVITDDVRCGGVSTFLDMEIDVLARALLEMQRRGLVSTTADGNLRLDNLTALDELSEGRA